MEVTLWWAMTRDYIVLLESFLNKRKRLLKWKHSEENCLCLCLLLYVDFSFVCELRKPCKYCLERHNYSVKQVCIPVGCVPPTCGPYLPACTAQRGVCSQGGLCSREVCVCSGSVCSGSVCSGGVCPGGCVSQHALRQTPCEQMTDRQL